MHVGRAVEVLEHRDLPVEQLQHQIVDALQAAARCGIGGIARQLLQLVVDPADDAADPAVDDRMGRADQHRRHEFVVEQDVAVADFEDARDPEAEIAGLRGLAQLEGEPGKRDVDLLLDAQRRGRVDEGLGAAHVAAGAVIRSVVDLARVRRRDRHGEPGDLARRRIGHVDRLGDRAVGGNVERRAVRHHAGGAAHRELALLREVAVDFEMREAPRIGRRVAHPAFQQVLDVAVVLLQMMRSEEQALGPEYLAVPRHLYLVPATVPNQVDIQ